MTGKRGQHGEGKKSRKHSYSKIGKCEKFTRSAEGMKNAEG